jgi:hypothetical protein
MFILLNIYGLASSESLFCVLWINRQPSPKGVNLIVNRHSFIWFLVANLVLFTFDGVNSQERSPNSEQVLDQPQAVTKNKDQAWTICTEPRPQVCTMDYQPVCGRLKEGSLKTYSNGCMACSDPDVTVHADESCEE